MNRTIACSALSAAAGEPAWGTATRARFWLAVEQGGAWGKNALRQSQLDPELAITLHDACKTAGGRMLLVRGAGSAHLHQEHARHRVFVAACLPGRTWLRTATVRDVADLSAALDLTALADGAEEAVTAQWAEHPATAGDPLVVSPPVLLVCTNGRRDVCCAVSGRPVATAGAAAFPGRVWECSHTGGHRFAPTGLLLPHARMLARLTPKDPATLLSAAGAGQLPEHLLGAVHDRGSTALQPSAQAAEAYLRHLLAETDLTALRAEVVAGEDEAWVVRVVHTDGRAWTLSVTRVPLAQPRPVSCGKEPAAAHHWQVELDSGPVR